jgi:chaperonin GroES
MAPLDLRSACHFLRQGVEKMKLVPLGEKVVLRRLDSEEVTAGGIVLPDSARERPQQGKVLSVGDGRLLADGTRSEPQVGEGDWVLFDKFSGTEVEVNGQELLIMNETEILAILDAPPS